MKTKIKRHSRSVLSVVLALCMLLSCMTAGMIMTDAAKVDGDAVGASWTDHVNLKLYVDGTTDAAWTDISAINVHKTINFGNLRRNNLSIQIKADGNNEEYWLASENGAVSGNVGSGFENKWWKPGQSSVSVVSFDADCDYEVWWNQSDSSHGIQLNIKKVVGNQNWTVVGDNVDIFGGEWVTGDATHTANDMTYDSSSEKYVKKYSNVALTAGSFQYKIVKDHAWDTKVPSNGNQTCSVPANGHYDIQFEYDGSTLTCTLTALHQLTASTTDNSDYSLRVSGSTDISNVSGGINSGYYPENSTATVKVIPANNTKKVSKIVIGSNEYTPTNNGNGTYTYSFSVTADKIISAILVDKTNYRVSFSADPAAQGTVTAVDENGTPINSGDFVLEGTKVTFTASPNDGYVLSNWSGSFSDKLSTVTKTITADTTATANFAKQGYKIVYDGAYGANGKSMTEMPNGKFISSDPVENGSNFKILDTGRNAISKSTGTPQSLNADKEYGVKDWVTAPAAWDSGDSFKNNTGANAYVVYDPANDTVYLTSESDGMFSSYEVYIKDGTVRYLDNTWNGFSADYGTTTLESNGTTSGVTASPVTNDYNNHVKKITLTAAQVRNGVDLHIKTVVNSAYQSSYYVTGFDVNGGLTQALISQEFDDHGNAIAASAYEDTDAGAKIHTSHSNDFILKVTGEKFPDQKIEVTPIYFPLASKDTDFVRFYAYDFTEDVKRDWGGSLAVYPYIENKYDPYGKYPGQLMVNEGGVYYADIPVKHSDGTPIQGLTMNNYVWDALHYNLFYGSNQTDNNWQTYDYNEFTVINDILQNTQGLENEDIIFSFKYKETVDRTDSNLGESTYYKDSDTNNPNRDKDYRNGFQTIEVNDSQYDWEDLTDFYGNKVDIFDQLVEIDGNETKMGYNPIRIISNGYDDNAVGYYATAWALYKPVDASGRDAWTGTVDHYELFDVIGGQGRNARDFQSESFLIARASQKQVRMKYDGAYNNLHWGDPNYPQSQLILDAANVPVEITYEYNVQSNKSNIDSGPDQLGYRSDGRWYYSDSHQLIKANAIVEVANSKAGPFSRDYFQEDNYDYKSGAYYNPALNTGLNTRVKAYFTNDDLVVKQQSIQYQNVNGYTLAHAISDGEHSFSLKAEEDPDGNYMFVGWYRLTENGTGVGYSLASEDMEFSTEAKTNDVYVARFVKVPAGNVVITHTLASGSTGTATCLAKAEIYSDNACTNAVDTTTYGTFTEDAIKVNSKYIKSTSENYLKITLKTVLGDSTSFVEFQEKVQNTVNALTAGNDRLGILATVTVDTSGIDMYATITFPISALFTTTSGETEQTVKNLPFYSLSNQKNYAHTKILYSPDRSVSGGIDEAIETYSAEAVLSAFTRDYYQPGNVDWTSASGYDKTVVTGLNTKVQAYMTSGGNNVTELDFKANDVITLNAVDTSSEYQPRYSFVGWFVQKTDGAIEKLSNSSYTAAAADKDLVFIAVFEPVLTYALKYTYDSTHYGSQSYLVKGVFTTQEIEKYLVWSNTDPSAEGLSGSYAYNSETKAEFFASKSPYEKNIGKTFHWEFTNDTTSFYSNNHQLSSTIPSHNGTDTQRKIQFIFPYRVISTNGGIESQKTDGKVVIVPNGESYKDGQYSRYLTITSATYGQPYALNWEVNTSGEQVANYVTAEEKIFDSSNVEYHFAYWSIKNIPINVRTSDPNASDVITEYDKQVEVARCYNLGFNFTIYQDYIVEPVYEQSTSQIPKIHSNSATIAFTEYGRNQWNENGGGNSVPANQKVQGDKIFLQFMTAYDREDMIRLDSQTAITAGILYERLGQLTDAQKENMPTPVDLFNSYGTEDPTHGKAAAEAAVASTTSTTVGKEQYAILKLNTPEKLQKIDNKNRIALEQGVTHKNNKGQETGYANYIYRAYAYMVEENDTVTISDQPVYFTFYTIANMADGSSEG